MLKRLFIILYILAALWAALMLSNMTIDGFAIVVSVLPALIVLALNFILTDFREFS